MAKAQVLNPSQHEATQWRSGPMLVLAGAGGGKTRTLVETIASMINDGKIPANKILVQTFTKKAALEIQNRLNSLIGLDKAAQLFAGTFHSFCWTVMRAEVTQLANKKVGDIIAKDYRKTNFIEAILKEEVERSKDDIQGDQDAANILRRIGLAKCNLIYAQEIEESTEYFKKVVSNDEEARRMALIYRQYSTLMRNAGLMDFDDWLLIVNKLFVTAPALLEKYQDKYRYILSDEVQDQNFAQNSILRMLAGERANFFQVGDGRQSVYAFRGAVPDETILNFKDTYPNGKIINIRENYRSDGGIIKCANNLANRMDIPAIYREPQKAINPITMYPVVNSAGDQVEEGIIVVEKIQQMLDAGEKPSEIAILYRTNAQSSGPEQGLIEKGIPYVILDGASFYERKEVLDMIAYLELCKSTHSDYAPLHIKRVINYASEQFASKNKSREGKPAWTHFIGSQFISGMVNMARARNAHLWDVMRPYAVLNSKGDTQRKGVEDLIYIVDKIKRDSATGVRPSDILQWVFDNVYTHYLTHNGTEGNEDLGDTRKENCKQLIADLRKFVSVDTALAYFNYLKIQAEKNKKEATDAVQLMSLHRSKGLEFNRVFVIGANEDVLPHYRGDVHEERRLAYVGSTRARMELIWSYVSGRGEPSRFLFEMDIPSFMEAVDDDTEKDMHEKYMSAKYKERTAEEILEDEFLAELGIF